MPSYNQSGPCLQKAGRIPTMMSKLAEVTRDIYDQYGTDVQRYFDDLLGPNETSAEPPKNVGSDSGTRIADGQTNGSASRVP
jgi:hypothetical protein